MGNSDLGLEGDGGMTPEKILDLQSQRDALLNAFKLDGLHKNSVKIMRLARYRAALEMIADKGCKCTTRDCPTCVANLALREPDSDLI